MELNMPAGWERMGTGVDDTDDDDYPTLISDFGCRKCGAALLGDGKLCGACAGETLNGPGVI